MDKRASLLQWFAATAEAKLKAVQDYLRLDFRKNCPLFITLGDFQSLATRDLLSSDKKFLVFCHHQTMLKVTSIFEMNKMMAN